MTPRGKTSRAAAALALLWLSVAVADRAVALGSADGEGLRVMTFNIRYDNPADGEDAWPKRRTKAASMIRFHRADLVGLQEALRGQIADLEAALPELGWFGTGRSAQRDGEHCAVLFRKDRLEVLDQGTFWLSETPDLAGSRSWDAALPRIVTWGGCGTGERGPSSTSSTRTSTTGAKRPAARARGCCCGRSWRSAGGTGALS
jgi:hypothetical protein